MVAIYIPVLQTPSPIRLALAQTSPFNTHFSTQSSTTDNSESTSFPHAAHAYNKAIDNSKITFFLHALHAHNKAKDNHTTCLGTAVTYGRRCRNPIYKSKWAFAVAEMIEAAEDRGLYLADLKGDAGQWAKDFACYLHGGQKGVKMAVLGAIAVYRMEMEDLGWRLGLGGVHCLPGVESGDLKSVDGHSEFEALEEKEDKKADIAAEELLAQNKIEGQLREIRQKEKALELAEKERILLLCEKAMLLLESLKLKCELSTVVAEQKKKAALMAE